MEFDPEHFGQAPKHGQRRLVLTGFQAGNRWLPVPRKNHKDLAEDPWGPFESAPPVTLYAYLKLSCLGNRRQGASNRPLQRPIAVATDLPLDWVDRLTSSVEACAARSAVHGPQGKVPRGEVT